MKPTKLFDLYCNGNIVIAAKPMAFCKAMENTYKKGQWGRNCSFQIKYNSTIL